jgi:redox-sensitive bicupin YhaK (pirin superfamily)
MINLRPSNERGHFDFGWLKTFHSFSFGDYVDPAHDQFHALRVINEDRVQPGQGFGTHGHRDMEILTWVLEGALEHKDSLGNGGVIRPGEAQRMTAGSGIRHSEFNASDQEQVHFLQIWLFPKAANLPPSYEQKFFPPQERRDRLRLIASADGREGSVIWHQDASLYVSNLTPGSSVAMTLSRGRHAWVQTARGAVTVNGTVLKQGDGAALSEESALQVQAEEEAEVLIFELA